MFLDSFHVAEELRKQFPEDFESLVRIPATFQKIHFERYAIEALSDDIITLNLEKLWD